MKDVVAANRELKMGSTGPGSTYDDMPQILNRTLKTKFKVISGYEGTSTILVAMRRMGTVIPVASGNRTRGVMNPQKGDFHEKNLRWPFFHTRVELKPLRPGAVLPRKNDYPRSRDYCGKPV